MSSSPKPHPNLYKYQDRQPPAKRPRLAITDSSASDQKVPEVPKVKSPILRPLTTEQVLTVHGYKTYNNKLGTGRYSKVFLVKNKDGLKIAMKVVDMAKVSKEFLNKFLPREVYVWSQLNHPNIVRMYEYFESGNKVFMSLEYVRCGDLLLYVQKEGPLSEHISRLWFMQLLSAIYYLHKRGIAHRDLKLENILIEKNGHLKITDLGFARQIDPYQLSQTFCGSKSYSAPEILIGTPYDPFKADVWSLGVVLFVLITNRMPFNERVPSNLIIIDAQRTRAYRFPRHLHTTPWCQQIIDDMLIFDWRERPSIIQVSHYDWLQSFASGDHVTQGPIIAPPPPEPYT